MKTIRLILMFAACVLVSQRAPAQKVAEVPPSLPANERQALEGYRTALLDQIHALDRSIAAFNKTYANVPEGSALEQQAQRAEEALMLDKERVEKAIDNFNAMVRAAVGEARTVERPIR